MKEQSALTVAEDIGRINERLDILNYAQNRAISMKLVSDSGRKEELALLVAWIMERNTAHRKMVEGEDE